MPDFSKTSYQFAYFKDQLVPFPIKVYNIIQSTETLKLVHQGTSREQF